MFGPQNMIVSVVLSGLNVRSGGQFIMRDSGRYEYDGSTYPRVEVVDWRLSTGSRAVFDSCVEESSNITWDAPIIEGGAELAIEPCGLDDGSPLY